MNTGTRLYLSRRNQCRNAQVFLYFLKQTGSYFGGSVCGVDLNNDGMDDLLVGAPMFTDTNSDIMDEGRVFVYLNDGMVMTFWFIVV